MTVLFIVAISGIGAIGLWILYRRVRMTRRKRVCSHLIDEEPATGESKAESALTARTPKTDRGLNSLSIVENSKPSSSPDLGRSEKTDLDTPQDFPQHSADVQAPEGQVQTSTEPVTNHLPSIPSIATLDITLDEASSAYECEIVQSTTVPDQLATPTNGLMVETSNIFRGEPIIPNTETPVSWSETTAPINESDTQATIADDECIESGTIATAESSMFAPHLLSSDEVATDVHEKPSTATTDTEAPLKPPSYQPLAPPTPVLKTLKKREQMTRPDLRQDFDLGLRLQLVFGHGGTVKILALVPERSDGMPSEVEITGTQGKLLLTELRDDCYEPILLTDAAIALKTGVEWRGSGDARQWRWILGGRELYVLVQGDKLSQAMHGFISTARLLLNARHVVLTKAHLHDDVLAALAKVGCDNINILDEQMAGVPNGWLLFSDVTPTCAARMRDEQDILNALCPAYEIEPQFVGGIRIERNTWLTGFPPLIRFRGELRSDFHVMIDGQSATHTASDAYESTGWDSEGVHRLWFDEHIETYSIRNMEEYWDGWSAYDFGTGMAICGAGIYLTKGTHWCQVRIPVSNPVLVGARPGEIFRSQTHHNVRSQIIFTLAPFSPVWALPEDALHSDKRTTRIVMLNAAPPITTDDQASRKRDIKRALRKWVAAINDARYKQLSFAEESLTAKALWRQYCVVAKRLSRRMRES